MTQQKILVADDDKQYLRSITLRLRRLGYDVIEAQDGQQAIDLARQSAPDLLILDVHMPSGNGFESIKAMDQIPELHYLPVIYVTGDGTETTARIAEAHGAMSVLRKPVNMRELVETIKLLIGPAQPMPFSWPYRDAG